MVDLEGELSGLLWVGSLDRKGNTYDIKYIFRLKGISFHLDTSTPFREASVICVLYGRGRIENQKKTLINGL
jgi:hypothetical protein